jgi:hypothetical protein
MWTSKYLGKTINNRQIVKKPSPPCEIGDEDKND